MANHGIQEVSRRAGILGAALLLLALPCRGADFAARVRQFVDAHCVSCHDTDTKKGGLDLTDLAEKPLGSETFDQWVKVFDLVESERMPPRARKRPELAPRAEFLSFLRS